MTHQQLTHRSELVSTGLAVFIPMRLRLINGDALTRVITDTAPTLWKPTITGDEPGREYRTPGYDPGSAPGNNTACR
ncbi:hypothetical protein [Salicola sp. Rm-C-2C1-2]|uniref:hypothetical protein n=1 Tax=Salicola sp. Rm-C-2C1-2 TaxID=3141321 RepID=UPI0032E3AD61